MLFHDIFNHPSFNVDDVRLVGDTCLGSTCITGAGAQLSSERGRRALILLNLGHGERAVRNRLGIGHVGHALLDGNHGPLLLLLWTLAFPLDTLRGVLTPDLTGHVKLTQRDHVGHSFGLGCGILLHDRLGCDLLRERRSGAFLGLCDWCGSLARFSNLACVCQGIPVV